MRLGRLRGDGTIYLPRWTTRAQLMSRIVVARNMFTNHFPDKARGPAQLMSTDRTGSDRIGPDRAGSDRLPSRAGRERNGADRIVCRSDRTAAQASASVPIPRDCTGCNPPRPQCDSSSWHETSCGQIFGSCDSPSTRPITL